MVSRRQILQLCSISGALAVLPQQAAAASKGMCSNELLKEYCHSFIHYCSAADIVSGM